MHVHQSIVLEDIQVLVQNHVAVVVELVQKHVRVLLKQHIFIGKNLVQVCGSTTSFGGHRRECSTCRASESYYWCSCGYTRGAEPSHKRISCTTCGGDGRVSTSTTHYCSHGYYNSHYYCQHSNNRSSATHYYCAHSQAGVQHD